MNNDKEGPLRQDRGKEGSDVREGGGRRKTEAICLTSSGTLFLEAQPVPTQLTAHSCRKLPAGKQSKAMLPIGLTPARLPKAAAQLLLAAVTGWEAA